jgi:hypothetical protein
MLFRRRSDFFREIASEWRFSAIYYLKAANAAIWTELKVDEEIVALFIPIVSVIVTGLLIWVFFLYRYKTRLRVQETIQSALERGTELTPDLIDRMAGPRPSKDRDMRRGLVSVAIGVAFALFGFLVDEEDAVGPMIGIGTFPFLVGLAYLLMWRLGNRES